MTRYRRAVILPAIGLLVMAVTSGDSEPTPAVPQTNDSGFVLVCPIDSEIDDSVTVVVERAIEESDGAAAIIFEIDTPGGRVDSAIEITEAIKDAGPRTIAYIQGMGAISAGALISFACDDIIMEPGTTIGAATPVYFTSEGPQVAGEKETSFMRARFRALAEENGHNPDIGEAMVDKNIELRARKMPDGSYFVYRAGRSDSGNTNPGRLEDEIDRVFEPLEREIPIPLDPIKDGVRDIMRQAQQSETPDVQESTPRVAEDGSIVIIESGELLTWSSKLAEQYSLIPTTAATIEQVMGYYGLGNLPRVSIEMTWQEKLYRWLVSPMVSGLLLMLGIGGIYIEIKTPGFGAPGVIGIVCLSLFFGARVVLGLADWIDIVLVLAGFGLILFEVFVTPGFGIPGIVGMLCIVAGVVMSFVLHDWTIPEYQWDFDRIADAGKTLSITFATLIPLIAVLWYFLPKTSMFNPLVLTASMENAAGYVVQTGADEEELIGLRGVALSMLRPAGRARIGDKTVQVVTRGDFIAKGTPVEVVQVDGNRYVVEQVKENA